MASPNITMASTSQTSISNPTLKFKEPLTEAIYASLASELVKVELMDAPKQISYALTYSYNKAGVRGTQLLVVDKDVSANANAEMLYASGNHVLIKSDTKYKVNDTFNGAKVLEAYDNKFGQMPTLLNFGRASVGLNQTENPFTPQIDYSISGVALSCDFSRKLKASVTIEALQDMRALYGDSFKDKLSSYLLSEILNGIDAELLQYLREKATVCPEVLDFDAMKENGYYDIPNEIVSVLLPYINIISLTTMKPDRVFVIGTPNAMKHLLSHPNFIPLDDDVKETKHKRGTLFGWDIYTDVTGSCVEDYILVGSSSKKDASASSAILGIYNKTETDIVSDYDSGEANVYSLVQYDIKHNPLDSNEKNNSAFLKLFKVKNAIKSANPTLIKG